MHQPGAGGLVEGRARTGRPRATSRADLERIGFELFERRGFDAVTVDDIAVAAGIGRRTFFRYYASKNDLVWGDFEGHLVWLRELLAAVPVDVAAMTGLRTAIVEFNRFDPETVPWHRRRMELILHVPALQADSTLRYAAWRAIVTDFAAARAGLLPTDPGPTLTGHVALATSVAAYELWLRDDGSNLADLLDDAFGRLAAGL
ncbi:mycofactocin system transcriptional regulator [Streptomyces sp. NBC_01762]|uniref:mycofactocin system transcriptional regulator n=1 Tax=Streptomyces sp. NBC_01762 TaxID=2975933 RepID=UPI002DDC7A6D|nr:mycofactocin system transcriptional regulator [Streptomyces sp. NBC_01762]WSC49314.1 mycofactocin system transcriptional regulator [Streptomyces sp. NBC_01762]